MYCGFTLGIISLSVLILKDTTLYNMHGEPNLNGWYQHQNDYPRWDLDPSRHVRKFCPFGDLRMLGLKPTHGGHQGLKGWLQYSLSSALLVMSDFESKFLKEYSWLQRSYHIPIVKAVMTLWGLNTKKARHTHYRSQTAALFLMKTEKPGTSQKLSIL